jgi:MFS family permease
LTGPSTSLWRHGDFLKLWAAQTVSSFGARIAREGLPFTALMFLRAGPAAYGVFAAARLAASAVGGVVAGPLADRFPKRALMIGADLARAAVLIAVPAAAFTGHLTFAGVIVAGVLMGFFSVAFDIADHAFLPTLIAPAQLVDGNAKLGTTEAVAETGGPALYGVLFQTIGAPLALVVNAGTYMVSALTLAFIRPRAQAVGEPAQQPVAPIDLAAGFRIVLDHPLVRPIWLADVTQAFFGGFFSALYLLFLYRQLHLTPLMIGMTVAAGGIGGFVGAVIAPAVTRRLGVGWAIVATAVSGGAMQFFVPLAHGAPLLAMGFLVIAQLFGDGLQTIAGIATVSFRQAVLPAHELGRAGGAFATGTALMGVVGALGGGLLGASLGPRETLYMAAAGITLATVFVLVSPLRKVRSAEEAAPSASLDSAPSSLL